MKSSDIISGRNDPNYVSIKSLFKACCYMHDRYVNAYNYSSELFSIKNDYIRDYSLDYYDFKKKRLVLLSHYPFSYLGENSYYFKLKDGCVVPAIKIDSQEQRENYDSIISKYCEEITKTISLLKEFEDFKTNSCKNIKVYGSSYLLDIDSYGIGLSLVNSGEKRFRVDKRFYFISGNEYDSNSNEAIDDYISNERKILKNSYVMLSDMPSWSVCAINDYSYRGILGKLIKKPKKLTASFDVIERLKEEEKKENAKKKKLDSIMKEMSGLINEAGSLNYVDEYERIHLNDYSVLFEKKNDHLEIKKIFIPFLKYIDLSLVPFDNVYVAGIDFTDSNITFNPQKVYKKDLSFCTFGDVDRKENMIPFSLSTNFSGVDLRGTVISDPHCDFHYNLKGAIVDESTSINYGNVDKNKAFFIKRDM